MLVSSGMAFRQVFKSFAQIVILSSAPRITSALVPMAGRVSNDTRDQLMSAFRERVCERLEVAPFLHQRTVWAAGDGLVLTGNFSATPVAGWQTVRTQEDGIVWVEALPRPEGRARFLSDLGAFKIGKSFGAALWASGFACIPAAKVSMVAIEYNVCEPEFTYLAEFLLSERGMNLKAKSFVNRPRQGDMYMELANGAVFECRSWERKESLKGKENDAYIYCEAYQLPGIECFTSFSQNLRARRGFAYFATTPDRPWIKQLHELGHGADAEWHCTCSVGAEANPYTFDLKAKKRDQSLMTKEKYEIHYNGQLGDFVGRVFNFTRGTCVFDDQSHPELFDTRRSSDGPLASLRSRLRVPDGWEVVGGADTGTFYAGLFVAFAPNGDAFVLEEFPNYRYVAGTPERDESLTIPQWCRQVVQRASALSTRANLWADPNSQFKAEFRNYGVTLLPAKVPVEARTEITREYFQHGRIFLAPWLEVLPFELENACWPEEASATGKFARMKDRDHTLDPLEHILARRPIGRPPAGSERFGSWLASQGYGRKNKGSNVHLGSN
jgi:hypothetical protein